MITKTKINISIDTLILEEATRILKEVGLKKSTFIELILRMLVDSETKPLNEVYGPLFESVGQGLKEKAVKRKKEGKIKKARC